MEIPLRVTKRQSWDLNLGLYPQALPPSPTLNETTSQIRVGPWGRKEVSRPRKFLCIRLRCLLRSLAEAIPESWAGAWTTADAWMEANSAPFLRGELGHVAAPP